MAEAYGQLARLMLPEVILVLVACALLFLGFSVRETARRVAPWVALAALAVVFVMLLLQAPLGRSVFDQWRTLHIMDFTQFLKLLTAGVGILLVLLAWPTNADATGNSAMNFGNDAGEFFALMLLSISGLFIVAGANDVILLFLGLELASIPTYIMVSISRPLAVAQEGGVKYFFLGAMGTAVMLFGFSYLYGTTGVLRLDAVGEVFRATAAGGWGGPQLNSWQLLSVIMLLIGFSYKIAAVPMHFYVGDVYQGAATPVTAFLAYVPKAAGFAAILKLLFAAGGNSWQVPDTIVNYLWVVAVFTMTVGNVLGLLQFNVKRVLAYSSVAHSGYMLVGVTALVSAGGSLHLERAALQGVLFYLTAYGLMNAAAFGVLMLLPARPGGVEGAPAPSEREGTGSAETFDDIAGQGRRHLGLGLAMAVSCFSLTGLPLTIGFFGKLYLLLPALQIRTGWMIALAIILLVNAAIAAAYYLRIVAAMFLREEAAVQSGTTEVEVTTDADRAAYARPVVTSITLSVGATLLFGIVLPATELLSTQAFQAADSMIHSPVSSPAVAVDSDLHSP
jgi:NADH-quinone oxidoreductase subunit N